MAKAQFELRRYEDALNTIQKGLKNASSSQDLINLRTQINEILTKEKMKQIEKEKEILLKKNIAVMKRKAIEAKKVNMGVTFLHQLQRECKDTLWFSRRSSISSSPSSSSSSSPTSSIHPPNSLAELTDVVASPSSYELHTPFLFCYPEYETTDLVQNASEDDTILQQLMNLLPLGEKDPSQKIEENNNNNDDDENLTSMFPVTDYPPWDRNRSYSLRNVRLFYRERWVPSLSETDEKNNNRTTTQNNDSTPQKNIWIEVPIEMKISDLMRCKSYVVPGFPLLYVLDPKSGFTKKFLS